MPAILVSAVMLFLTHRTNKRLELLRAELQKHGQISILQHKSEIEALEEIYDAFCEYLDFLRRKLYFSPSPISMDPMWDFNKAIQKNLVRIRPSSREAVQRYQFELLEFWNWALGQPRSESLNEETELRRRLDFEIPSYLEKLRGLIDDICQTSTQQGA